MSLEGRDSVIENLREFHPLFTGGIREELRGGLSTLKDFSNGNRSAKKFRRNSFE